MDDDLVRKLRNLGTNGYGIGAADRLLLRAAADEIERLRSVLRTIVFRADAAKTHCEQGVPVSAYVLASGILGQIGEDAAALRADPTFSPCSRSVSGRQAGTTS